MKQEDIDRVMVWAKDLNNCFTYVNRCFCEDFLDLYDPTLAIGKSGKAFTSKQGDGFTFGKVCSLSDQQCLESGKPVSTTETGLIKGIERTVAIYKWPLLDDQKLIGTIGLCFFVKREG